MEDGYRVDEDNRLIKIEQMVREYIFVLRRQEPDDMKGMTVLSVIADELEVIVDKACRK